jgi:hypothetical protein
LMRPLELLCSRSSLPYSSPPLVLCFITGRRTGNTPNSPRPRHQRLPHLHLHLHVHAVENPRKRSISHPRDVARFRLIHPVANNSYFT